MELNYFIKNLWKFSHKTQNYVGNENADHEKKFETKDQFNWIKIKLFVDLRSKFLVKPTIFSKIYEIKLKRRIRFWKSKKVSINAYIDIPKTKTTPISSTFPEPKTSRSNKRIKIIKFYRKQKLKNIIKRCGDTVKLPLSFHKVKHKNDKRKILCTRNETKQKTRENLK